MMQKVKFLKHTTERTVEMSLYAKLSKLVGHQIVLDKCLLPQAEGFNGDFIIKGLGCDLAIEGDRGIKKSPTGSGLWIPYSSTRAVAGFISAGQSWIASGLFSGCKFAIGNSKKTDQVFGAHIAQESGSTADSEYEKFKKTYDINEWYNEKIPMPFITENHISGSCSYVFADCTGGGLVSLVRIDVLVKTYGGSDGIVMAIHQI